MLSAHYAYIAYVCLRSARPRTPAACRIACRRSDGVDPAPGLDFVGRRRVSATTLRVPPCLRTRKPPPRFTKTHSLRECCTKATRIAAATFCCHFTWPHIAHSFVRYRPVYHASNCQGDRLHSFVKPAKRACSCAAEAAFRVRRACRARQGAADAPRRTRRSLMSGRGEDGADRRRRFDMRGRI